MKNKIIMKSNLRNENAYIFISPDEFPEIGDHVRLDSGIYLITNIDLKNNFIYFEEIKAKLYPLKLFIASQIISFLSLLSYSYIAPQLFDYIPSKQFLLGLWLVIFLVDLKTFLFKK